MSLLKQQPVSDPIEVAPGIYVLTEPLEGRRLSVVLIVDDGDVALIDTGIAETPERLVSPALAALGLDPEAIRSIVITHSDIDHSGGLGVLRRVAPRAVSIAHRLDVGWIEDVDALIEQRYCGLRDDHGIAPDTEFFDWVHASDSGAQIDIGVVGGEALCFGNGRPLELVHVPGHSRGHLAVIDPATGTGLIGDAVFGRVTPFLDGSGAFGPGYYDLAAYRETIKRLAELDLKRMIGTHYPTIEGDEVREFLAESEQFCQDLDAAVLAVLEHGRPLTTRQIVEGSAPTVRAWPPEADIGLAVAVVAHLQELETQGRVQRNRVHPSRGAPVTWEAA